MMSADERSLLILDNSKDVPVYVLLEDTCGRRLGEKQIPHSTSLRGMTNKKGKNNCRNKNQGPD
jgi:hypothetical protein